MVQPHICFDLDGTLVDSRDDLASAANAARAHFGLSALPVEQVAGYVGNGLLKLLQRSAPEIEDHEGLVAAFHAHYAAHCCDATTAYPGVVDTLTKLYAAGWIITIATNKPLRYVPTILEGIGVADIISAIRGGDNAKKPDPQQLHELAEEVSAPILWMVGDHDTDLLAAANYGCRAAWCNWGIGHHHGAAYDVEIASLSELMSVVENTES